jgi:Flp pilus assembly pilin Flp
LINLEVTGSVISASVSTINTKAKMSFKMEFVMQSQVRKFLADDHAVTSVKYALLAILIAIALISSANFLSSKHAAQSEHSAQLSHNANGPDSASNPNIITFPYHFPYSQS